MNAQALDCTESTDGEFLWPVMREKPRPRVRRHFDFLAHSAANIDSWKSYLPDDCVAAMIKMGWDRTT
jgi:hypothetical protein